MSSTNSPEPWVIRSDFFSEESWQKVQGMIAAPQRHAGIADEFYAYVTYINDPKYSSKSPQEIFRSLPDDYLSSFCFIVDSECIQNAEHPVLVVAFRPSQADYESFTLRKPSEAPLGQIAMFRALPSQIQSIQNNLSIANMDFEDFANSVDSDGVFRGFKR